jgi:hypothetical protein
MRHHHSSRSDGCASLPSSLYEGSSRFRPPEIDSYRPSAPILDSYRPPVAIDTYRPTSSRSRYSSRYDGDRRSRSPRDRSPDRYNDRRSQYSDGDQRRLSGESRTNQAAFQSNRDSFQREPPRGPKAERLALDAPSGPRGGGYSAEFRGRGRGRGRGGWREESRDRGRGDREDFRDRRDGPPFRDERSRERERDRDRDWRERDRENRDTRDGFRGRRPTSPQGRGRSPPGRDFRDRVERDAPLGVDSERARRGSRDGPLSAGSSSSDPAFNTPAYRGGFGRGRGGPAPRGRGSDWGDRGRGRGGYYDDRDQRYARSRSQEGRWGRDRDDRDAHRYGDPESRPRERPDERDARDRENARPKSDRNSITHEQSPSTKDVSPPPIAPSAPAFGSVPSRNPSAADIQSLTGKPPPTGPRALTEERPQSSGVSSAAGERVPPSGPSKPRSIDGSPPVPTGPRAQVKAPQRPSSKQWINPALTSKKVPESAKVNRSHSFVSQQSRPFGARPESSSSDHHHGDQSRRPRSSDAKADMQLDSTDGRLRSLHISEPGDIKSERRTQSARASVDRDMTGSYSAHSAPFEADRAVVSEAMSPTSYKTTSPTTSRVEPPLRDPSVKADIIKTDSAVTASRKLAQFDVVFLESSVPQKQPAMLMDDHSSSDDEDLAEYFDSEIKKVETEIKKLEEQGAALPVEAYEKVNLVDAIHLDRFGQFHIRLSELLGPVPDDVEIPWNIVEEPAVEDAIAGGAIVQDGVQAPNDSSSIDGVRQPKVEDMDTDTPQVPIPTVERDESRLEDTDVVMNDVDDAAGPFDGSHLHPGMVNGINGDARSNGVSSDMGSRRTTPSQLDDDDAVSEEIEIDVETIEKVRNYMATPPLDELPQFGATAWYEDHRFLKSLSTSPRIKSFFFQTLRADTKVKREMRDDICEEYVYRYNDYLRFTMSDDPVVAKSRQKLAGDAPPPVIASTSITETEPKPEGRTTGRRFASERDLERVIEASKREEAERKEREERAQQEKKRSDKEAGIPPMFWTKEDCDDDLYIDRTGLVSPEKMITGWQAIGPDVNFTDEEIEQFEKAYLEFPKQWGRIADQLEKRDFHACIQYYYTMKRDLNLKEKLKRQPKKRKKGTRKQRSSALVSELGNGDGENEDTNETGENGERRRPRRAAAPTFNSDNPAADSDGPTPAGTPGRRGAGAAARAAAAAAAAAGDGSGEKTEVKKGRKRGPKVDKEPKQPKITQPLAPTPVAGAKGNRSRSNSRAQGPEWQSAPSQGEVSRLPTQYEVPQTGMQPPMVPAQPLMAPERGVPLAPSSLSEVMAPPSLRPEPPPPPQNALANFELGQVPGADRIPRTQQQASSYWSVSETNDFPSLLRSFGTDWHSIAAHMQTKTAVMVRVVRFSLIAYWCVTDCCRLKTTTCARKMAESRNGRPLRWKPMPSGRAARRDHHLPFLRRRRGSDTMHRPQVLTGLWLQPIPTRQGHPRKRRLNHLRRGSVSFKYPFLLPRHHQPRLQCRLPSNLSSLNTHRACSPQGSHYLRQCLLPHVRLLQLRPLVTQIGKQRQRLLSSSSSSSSSSSNNNNRHHNRCAFLRNQRRWRLNPQQSPHSGRQRGQTRTRLWMRSSILLPRGGKGQNSGRSHASQIGQLCVSSRTRSLFLTTNHSNRKGLRAGQHRHEASPWHSLDSPNHHARWLLDHLTHLASSSKAPGEYLARVSQLCRQPSGHPVRACNDRCLSRQEIPTTYLQCSHRPPQPLLRRGLLNGSRT